MRLGKFTQIRPVNTGNIVQLVKLHFPLEIDLTNHTFVSAYNAGGFQKLRAEAREYLTKPDTVNRISSIVNFLDSEDSTLNPTNIGVSLLPPEAVMRLAYVLSWIDNTYLFTKEGKLRAKYESYGQGTYDAVQLEFPEIMKSDLLALYLLPGRYPEYRRLLGWLYKLLSLMLEVGTGKTNNILPRSIKDLENPKRPAYKLFKGRILFPSHMHAADPPKVEDDTTPVTSTTENSDNTLIAGQDLAQMIDIVKPKVLSPRPVARPNYPDISFGTTSNTSGIVDVQMDLETRKALKGRVLKIDLEGGQDE